MNDETAVQLVEAVDELSRTVDEAGNMRGQFFHAAVRAHVVFRYAGQPIDFLTVPLFAWFGCVANRTGVEREGYAPEAGAMVLAPNTKGSPPTQLISAANYAQRTKATSYYIAYGDHYDPDYTFDNVTT